MKEEADAFRHTADALQKLCQQRTPVPPWAMMHRVLVPQSTSARAADVLIKALGGEEMAFKVVGGTKWWQVRAGKGLECEWIAMKKGYQKTDAPSKTPAAKSSRSVPASGTATPAESYPLEGADKNPADCGCEFTRRGCANSSRSRGGSPMHAIQ